LSVSSRNGIYPRTAFPQTLPPPPAITRAVSPENSGADSDDDVEPSEVESRRLAHVLASIGDTNVAGVFSLILIGRLEDGMNRHLTCQITAADEPDALADELVENKFICPVSHYNLCCLTDLHF
jgi:hypothetical protein